MSIIIDQETKVLIQGMCGKQARIHAARMRAYGTSIVAGVDQAACTVDGIPVYSTVKDACKKHKPELSLIMVPAEHALEAAMEALNANLHIIIITEGIPVNDVLHILFEAQRLNRIMIGPSSPGIITPGKSYLGILHPSFFSKGNIGIMTRSGTVSYAVAHELTKQGIGQSTVIGLGADMVTGMDFASALHFFEADDNTKVIVLIGKIGEEFEQNVIDTIKNYISKPVIAYIIGTSAPPGRVIGHTGTLIQKFSHTAQAKIDALEHAGVKVARLLHDLPPLVKSVLEEQS